ncbi:hypothetical protein EV702DRAFT_1113851 [Suillus placidus]|uniref:Uncharacterized protein n=1 Tax=Suillus placidus TaxID=48579 RepID=A0A9P7D1U7_9AGAM|nr:hypothetical protein EV702DRAFT_1113851 [Suillus placidus]
MSSSESATVTSVNVFDDSKADTRRYATFIHSQIVEGMSFMYLDEEDDDDDSSLYTDFISSWEFDSGPVACAADPKPSDAVLSEAQELVNKHQEHPDGVTEAQRIIQEYLQRHQRIEDQGNADVNNRDSAYTNAVTDDGQSTIDLEKRPEPDIRLFHHDPEGVAQAQLQGLGMVQAGHCTPGAMIRCQRPGCTDVLRDLEALKFHLHIHNIGDMSDVISISSAHTQKTKTKEPGHSSTESSPLNKSSGKARDRSKSFMDMDAPSGHSCDTPPTRKVYAKDPYSPPRSRNFSATHINSHTRTKVLDASIPQTRGRRSNRSAIRSRLDEPEYHGSIAMVLSRPASPVQGAQEALGSDMKLPVNFVNKSSVPSAPASSTFGEKEKELSRATSPKRAFSPARALSPIRDRLRRVLSFGCLNECNE